MGFWGVVDVLVTNVVFTVLLWYVGSCLVLSAGGWFFWLMCYVVDDNLRDARKSLLFALVGCWVWPFLVGRAFVRAVRTTLRYGLPRN